jgi:hypothetical protein
MSWSFPHPRMMPSSCIATTCPSISFGHAGRSPDSPTGTASTEGPAPSMSDNVRDTWPRSTRPIGQRNSARATSRSRVSLLNRGGTYTASFTTTTTDRSRSPARLPGAARSTFRV